MEKQALSPMHKDRAPGDGETVIFANPISGRGRGVATARRLGDFLEKAGFRPRLIFSRADEAEIPKLSDIRAAVCIGGDGTLKTVCGRLVGVATRENVQQIPFPMAIIGMGTANLMAQHTGNLWHSDTFEREVTMAILGSPCRNLDVAKTDRGIFLIMAGVGFDGRIIHELERTRTGTITHLSYIKPVMRAMATYEFPSIEVSVDGQTVFPMQSGLCFIGNAREYGTGFPLLVDAKSDDGLLDVIVLPVKCKSDLWRLAMAMFTADHVKQEGVIYTKGRHIEVHAEKPVEVQIDGEEGDFTPVCASILDVKIPFVHPALGLHAHNAMFRRLFRQE